MSILITVINLLGHHEFCDERCYNAIGPKCDCVCGGINHGKGLPKAIQNTIELSKYGNQDNRKWRYATQLELNLFEKRNSK